MNDRQAYALTHPLNDAVDHQALTRCRHMRQRGDGTLLVVILAVDR